MAAMFSNERFNQLLSEHLNTLMGARSCSIKRE